MYTHNKHTVFVGRKAIATIVISEKGSELVILQGMPRREVIKQILLDCPEFAKAEGITEDYYPKLVSENSIKRLNK